MFDRVFHADWSCDPKKRWLAAAERRGDAWKVDAPKPASTTAELLILMHRCRQNSCRALFGFDLPIGLPITFGRQIEFEGFVHALSEFGGGPWQAFFRVADRPEEVSIWRPFYPNTSRIGRQNRRQKADALVAFADTVAHPWAAHSDRTNAGDDLALGQMPVAN
jgi:hypothetical protein